jgi:hypothetical protein
MKGAVVQAARTMKGAVVQAASVCVFSARSGARNMRVCCNCETTTLAVSRGSAYWTSQLL